MPNPYAKRMLHDAREMGMPEDEIAVLRGIHALEPTVAEQFDSGDVDEMVAWDKETAVTALEGRFPGTPPFVHQYAYGAHVTDVSGREAVDAHTGILSVLYGHNNPKLLMAYIKALATGVWMPTSTHINPRALAFKDAIINSLSLDDNTEEDPMRAWRVLFASGGNIAGDNARRIGDGALYDEGAERVQTDSTRERSDALADLALGGNSYVILFEDAYSGNGIRGNAECGVGPWRGITTPGLGQNKVFIQPTIESFERAIAMMPKGVKPIFHAEQILGVGGFKVVPIEVLEHIVRRVHELGGLFIADEVQTAPCRTGEAFWYWQSWAKDIALQPDMVVFAKGFGNGRPVAGVAVRGALNERLLELQKKGFSLGKWFDTNQVPPPEAALGEEGVKMAIENDYVGIARRMGAELRLGLKTIGAMYPDVVDNDSADSGVPGKGLMSGLRFRSAGSVAKAMPLGPEHGVLFGNGGREMHDPEDFRGAPNTLRIAPPVGATTSSVVAEILTRLQSVVKRISTLA
ncbi:MAG: aminotransferase class III-fold pyridoxal phosphate-dependent enzyme [Patescibacteria group bacterium]